MASENINEAARDRLRQIIAEHELGNEMVEVSVGTLTTKQAIGDPTRQDYPLLEGREVMIEARFKGSFGQAFTDRPHDFRGSLNDILNLGLDTNEARAIFNATLNAVTAYLGLAGGTRHCHDEEPEECAAEMAQHILARYGKVKVGLVGYQPAILENLVKVFGGENVRCTDLNPKNVGQQRYGAEVWDGRTDTEKLVEWCDILLATSSTLVNGTFDGIRVLADAKNKKMIVFGITGAGVSALFGLERLCFQPH